MWLKENRFCEVLPLLHPSSLAKLCKKKKKLCLFFGFLLFNVVNHRLANGVPHLPVAISATMRRFGPTPSLNAVRS